MTQYTIFCVILKSKAYKKLDEKDRRYEDLRHEIKEMFIKQGVRKSTLELMFENMGEMRDYFSISKGRERLSFWLAVLTCLTVIVGGISKIFAAMNLIIHKKSLTKLKHYCNTLRNNGMFLSTVNFVSNQ